MWEIRTGNYIKCTSISLAWCDIFLFILWHNLVFTSIWSELHRTSYWSIYTSIVFIWYALNYCTPSPTLYYAVPWQNHTGSLPIISVEYTGGNERWLLYPRNGWIIQFYWRYPNRHNNLMTWQLSLNLPAVHHSTPTVQKREMMHSWSSPLSLSSSVASVTCCPWASWSSSV